MLGLYQSGPRDYGSQASWVTRQVAEIDMGGVLDADVAILIVGIEDASQLGHHRFVIRIIRRWAERAAAQAAGEAIEIEFLKIRKIVRGVGAGAKKIAHVLLTWVAFFYTGVIGAKFVEQAFIISQEGSRVGEALVR